MAIFGKITVQVLVNGQALPEYEDDDIKDESPNLVLKHIEATSGAPFGIKLSVAEPYNIDCDSLAFYIWLDGSFAESRLLIKDQFSNNNRFWEQTIDGVTKNGCNNAELKPFIFSEITRGMFLQHFLDDYTHMIQLKKLHCKQKLRVQAPSRKLELLPSKYFVVAS